MARLDLIDAALGAVGQRDEGVSDVDPATEVADSASDLATSVLGRLPFVGVALLVVVAAWIVSRGVRVAFHRWLSRRHPPSFATVMSKLAGWLFVALGTLVALAVTFPSVKPVDLLAGAGIFSVAIGFAFKDILENLLAGVLILFRDPFRSGDQIAVGERVGVVEQITIRETRIRTFDGRQVLIPNATVYTNVVVVETAYPQRRDSFTVGVAYGVDLHLVRRVCLAALRNTDGVMAEPVPEALVAKLEAARIEIELRYWCSSRQAAFLAVRDRAIVSVKGALDANDVEMPAETIALAATPSLAAALHDSPDSSAIQARSD